MGIGQVHSAIRRYYKEIRGNPSIADLFFPTRTKMWGLRPPKYFERIPNGSRWARELSQCCIEEKVNKNVTDFENTRTTSYMSSRQSPK